MPTQRRQQELPNMPSTEEMDRDDEEEAAPETPSPEETGRSRLRSRMKSVEVEDRTSDAAPFLDPARRGELEELNNRSLFDYPGRGNVDLDKEVNQRNQLYGTVSKLRYNDEAQVTIERLMPETWEGVPTKGFSERFHVSTFQTADDLIDQVKRSFGGYFYRAVFSTPNKQGEPKTVMRCTFHINAPPVVKGVSMGQNGGVVNSTAAAPNPNIEMVSKVLDTQAKMIADARGDKDKEDPRMVAQITNIMREMRAASEGSNGAVMQILKDQLAAMTKDREKADRPDAGMIKFTAEQAANERNQLLARFDLEKTALENRHTQLLDNLRRDKEMDVNRINDQKNAEISRLTSQMQNNENQVSILKLTMETNFNTQLSNMRSQYENQLSSMKSAFDLQNTMNANRISSLETQVKTLESQRDQLQQEKFADLKNRPDSLSEMSKTIAVVRELAGGLGLSKDRGGPDEPEFVTAMKALKEIGIGDTIGKIADRFTRQQPQQMQQQMPFQPMGMYNVPVDAQGRPLVPPQAMVQPPPQFQQPPQPAPQQQRRTQHVPPPKVDEGFDDVPSPQPAPRQPPPQQEAAAPSPPNTIASLNVEELRPVAGLFERAMNEGWPLAEFVGEILKDFPRDSLQAVVNAGSAAFLDAVEKVAPPDSDLTSIKGTAWLKELFDRVRVALESSNG